MVFSLLEIYLLIGAVGFLTCAIVLWTFGGNDMLPVQIAGIVALALMIFVDIMEYLHGLTLGAIFGASLLICFAEMVHFSKSSPLMPRKEVYAFSVATVTRRAKNTAEHMMGQLDPDEEFFDIQISTAGVPLGLTNLFISELAAELVKNKLSLSSLERIKNGRRVVLQRIPTRMMRTSEQATSAPQENS